MGGNWNGRGEGEVKRRKGEEEERGEDERRRGDEGPVKERNRMGVGRRRVG